MANRWEFIAPRKDLARALSICSHIVGREGDPLHIRSGVHESAADSIVIATSGGDRECEMTVLGTGSLGPDFAIPIRPFSVIAEHMRGDVTKLICHGDQTMTVGSAGSKYRLRLLNTLPQRPNLRVSYERFLSINPEILDYIARRVSIFAATQYQSNRALYGVLFDLSDERYVDIVATDAYRLARLTLLHEDKYVSTSDDSCLIPADILPDLAATDPGNDVWFGKSPHKFYAGTDFCVISTNLLAGDYPEWRRIAPDTEAENAVVFPCDESVKAMQRLYSIMETNKITASHIMTIEVEADRLTFSASVDAVPIASEVIECSSGNDFKIKVHFDKFRQAVQAVEGEKVVLEMTPSPNVVRLSPLDASLMYRHYMVPIKGS